MFEAASANVILASQNSEGGDVQLNENIRIKDNIIELEVDCGNKDLTNNELLEGNYQYF